MQQDNRKTPVGILYRLIWTHIPSQLSIWDARYTHGFLARSSSWLSNYLLDERHPLVLVRLFGSLRSIIGPPAPDLLHALLLIYTYSSTDILHPASDKRRTYVHPCRMVPSISLPTLNDSHHLCLTLYGYLSDGLFRPRIYHHIPNTSNGHATLPLRQRPLPPWCRMSHLSVLKTCTE